MATLSHPVYIDLSYSVYVNSQVLLESCGCQRSRFYSKREIDFFQASSIFQEAGAKTLSGVTPSLTQLGIISLR
jgi:hypothetical protein